MNIHIRWMIRRDMAEVLAISQATDHPWTEEDFLRCLRQRNCIGMVVESHEVPDEYPVIGYMIYELQKHSLELINLAVAPSYRRQGVGSKMLAKLASKLSAHRRRRISVLVRESNLPFQLFMKGNRFRAEEVLRGFFDEPDEDGYLFRLLCAGAEKEEDSSSEAGVIEF